MKVTGSVALLQCLIHEGVDVVFGYPGGAIMPAYDAFYDFKDQLHHVLVRHEQGAAHAAEGYAWVSDKPGVCIATSGPGATNLVTGIADAMLDSLPVVFITGQVTKDLLGTDAFQETDVLGITMPITKWNYQITEAEEIPEIMAKAFFIAKSGRPGPVVVDITKNAQVDTLEWHYEKITHIPGYQLPELPKGEDLRAAAELINSAKKPMLLAGHGVRISGASNELLAFSEKTGIPVASTLHGLSCFPSGHPLYVGMLGMHGHYGPNVKTNEADLLIAVGMRFDDRVTGKLSGYAPTAKVIHIEIDPAEIDKNVLADVALVSEAKAALEGLTSLVSENNHDAWLAEFAECEAKEKEKVIDSEIQPGGGDMKMGEVINTLSEKTNGEALLVADVGQHQMMAARYYKFQKVDSWINSGGLGTMGFALPAAMGAKAAVAERDVIVICGDGGFQMTLQELATIAQEKYEIKIIILNNNYLGMVRQWQELFFDNRYSEVNLLNPDFVAITKGFGIEAECVKEREELSAALDRMLSHKGPYLLDIRVRKSQMYFPWFLRELLLVKFA